MGKAPLLRRNWTNLAFLAMYFVIALGTTWPLAANIRTAFPGGSNDTLVHYWNGWWAKQALSNGQSPYYTHYLYYPTGLSLVYHNFAWFSIVTWLALESWVGGIAAYDLSILINLALCGLAAFLLAHELTGDRRAAFLAGLIYQCWPFRLSQLDHPNLISTQFIPIFLLFLIRTLHRGRWWDGALTGAFLALVGYTRWQQLVPAAIVGGILLVCTLPGHIASRRRWLPALLLGALVTMAALAPPTLMLWRQQRSSPAGLLVEGEEAGMQVDLLAYLTPSRFHPVLKAITDPAYDRYYADRYDARRFAAYIGVTALSLAVFGAWKACKSSLSWAVMSLVLVSLALGPVLRVNGRLYPGAPMPYRLAAQLFVVRLLRVPDRFNMFLALPLAMLSAVGAAKAMTLIQQRSRRAVWASLCTLAGAILFEYAVTPIPLYRPQSSEFTDWLSVEQGEFAILNLPRSAVESKRYMYAQATHQHPIVQGKTPRFPEGTFDYLESHPWVGAMRQSNTMPPVRADVSRHLAELARDNVRYIVLHKASSNPLRMALWRSYFVVAPQFEDDHLVVYPTAPLAGHDFDLLYELAPGIGPISVTMPTDCLHPGGVLELDVGWGTTDPPGRNLEAKLSLVEEGGIVRQKQAFPTVAEWPTREWPANTVARATYTMPVSRSLPTGVYTLALALAEADTDSELGQSVAIRRMVVTEAPCALPVPRGAVGVNAVFGGELRLLGYQLRRDKDQVTLTLHWHAERLMQTDYVVFVHVLEPETGVRVAQDDAMPLRWMYPTTFWSAGQIIPDDIPLSLEGAPAGSYAVVIGVYDPVTMDRLSAVDAMGRPQPDDQMVLPGERIEVKEHSP